VSEFAQTIDPWGRVVFAVDDAAELLLRGHDLTTLLFHSNDDLMQYNRLCEQRNKPAYVLHTAEPLDVSPASDAAVRQAHWWLPAAYRDLDLHQSLLARCQRPEETTRVERELRLFAEHDLLSLLRLMWFLVDHWRANGVIWGVGRGSSVASYCLYLIGVHRIDSLRYGLDITEFLRSRPGEIADQSGAH
jgi:DNA polymerase III alpha subunit